MPGQSRLSDVQMSRGAGDPAELGDADKLVTAAQFQAASYTFGPAKIAPSTAAATPVPTSRSSTRRQLRLPARPLPKPPLGRIPITAPAHGFLPGRLFDARPQRSLQ